MIDNHDPSDLFASVPRKDVVEKSGSDPTGSLGTRLREAREARGLSLAECGDRLHLPAKVLARLEADDLGDPGHFVFLRGALQGYADFLGLPRQACTEALRAAAPAEQPALVSVARTSPARWLLQRYGTAATYVVLTAFIAVPLVLLGLRGGLERPAARIVSLDDSAPVSSTAGQAEHGAPAADGNAAGSPDSSPFRASMTPFAAIGFGDPGVQPPATSAAPQAAPAPAAGQHSLTLTASADCWFEITDAKGAKVDSGMLHAGDVRNWQASGPLHVTLGNADGVSVTSDGKPVDLAAFRHANIARLDLFGSTPAGSEND